MREPGPGAGAATPAGPPVCRLPAAEKGDAQAQLYVGEIFERGLAGQPDYAAAVTWYRRAADQGFSQALIALGALVQQGLGAPRDPALAEKLFRRAAGLPDEMPGDAAPAPGPGSRNDELSTKVSEQSRQIEELQKKLAARETDVGKDRARLKALQDQLAKSQAPDKAAADAKSQGLSQSLTERDRELARSKTAIADLQGKLAALQAQPPAPTVSPAELDHMRAQLAESQAATAARQREADQLRAELQQARQGAAGQDAKTQQLSQTLADHDRELDRAKAATAELRTKLAAVDPDELAKLRGDLAGAQSAMAAQQRDADKLRAELQASQAGSASREADLKQNLSKLEREAQERQAAIAAKDDEIKKLQDQVARIDAAPAVRGPAAEAAQPIAFPVAQFGHYHALVIGIDNYQRLPALKTPVDDAKAVAQVLRDEYAFDVVLLVDANRYDILAALNKFRQTLTDQDNLLIYYAGHGVLDTVNQRGNWMPVDAEPDNPANWISNIQITDMLNAMSARQILIVADTCYSGTLTRDVATAIGRTRNETERAAWYKIMISKPSRVALTSAGSSRWLMPAAAAIRSSPICSSRRCAEIRARSRPRRSIRRSSPRSRPA